MEFRRPVFFVFTKESKDPTSERDVDDLHLPELLRLGRTKEAAGVWSRKNPSCFAGARTVNALARWRACARALTSVASGAGSNGGSDANGRKIEMRSWAVEMVCERVWAT